MATELLIDWLNDAHAMEHAQIKMLERFIDDFENYPEIRNELRDHLAETKQQVTDVRECIAILGGTVAPTASSSLSCLSRVNDTLYGCTPHDKLVKGMIVMHASEHFEHATYSTLAQAARRISEDQIADVCERMAEEEIAMADWLEEQIPTVVASSLQAASTKV